MRKIRWIYTQRIFLSLSGHAAHHTSARLHYILSGSVVQSGHVYISNDPISHSHHLPCAIVAASKHSSYPKEGKNKNADPKRATHSTHPLTY
jgi:hypothetical protein